LNFQSESDFMRAPRFRFRHPFSLFTRFRFRFPTCMSVFSWRVCMSFGT